MTDMPALAPSSPAKAVLGSTGAARNRDRLTTLAGCAGIACAGLVGYFGFESDLAFLTRLVCAALFVMSLDLVTGYCGVATLGHAALYGAGAYAAGIAAVHGASSPLAMLGFAVLAGALAGALSGIIILRAVGLTQLVLSIAVGELASALANKASGVTGGSDGLSGITPDALFGRFDFDLFGHTAYVLGVACLIVTFALLRVVVTSPFGLLCRGIREDRMRAAALGARIRPPLVVMYVLAGAVAGLAGGLAAVATGVVGLDSLGFERSASALVMLVLGGTGTLFGALIGTTVFEVFQSIVSAAQSISLADVGRPAADRGGDVRPARSAEPDHDCFRRSAAETPAVSDLLRVSGLTLAFGGLKVSQDISIALEAGARTALIGPNGAGKTTFVNLVAGQLKPDEGRIDIDGENVTKMGVEARVGRGLVRTFQINRLFRELTVFQNVQLAALGRRRKTWCFWLHANADRTAQEDAAIILAQLDLLAVAGTPVSEIAYGQQRLVEIAIAIALRPKILLLDEPAAGVSRAESPKIIDAIDTLPDDIAVLMIEHDMDLVLRWAKRIIVLAAGRVIFDGPASAVTHDQHVREAYLGNYAGASA